MQKKMLQAADKALFVKHLWDYSNRPVNQKVRSIAASQLGITERSFTDKMSKHRTFRPLEVDVVERLFLSELGQTLFDSQLAVFIENQTDGDRRFNEQVSEQQDQLLDQVNDQLATAKILV